MGNHRGERGHPGHPGRDGRDGTDGLEGPPGPKGDTGDPGESSVLVFADGSNVLPGFRGIVFPRDGKLRRLFVHSRLDIIAPIMVFIEVNGDLTELSVTLEKGEKKASEKKKSVRVGEGDVGSLLARFTDSESFDSSLISGLLVSLLLE